MSTIHNKSAIFIQIDEDQVVNCVDLVWIAQIPNILNDRPEQHKNCPGGRKMSLLQQIFLSCWDYSKYRVFHDFRA